MPIQETNTIITDVNGVHFIPSGSLLNPLLGTSSTPQTFIISQSATGNQIIHTNELNPYIKIPILSGSSTTSNEDIVEILRFHTASFDIGANPYVSSSLYFTASNEFNTRFLNIPLTTADNAATVTTKIYNTITGSNYNLKVYSASLKSTSELKISFIRSGSFNTPSVYTSSIDDNSLHILQTITGSGLINYSEPYTVNPESASLSIKRDPKDNLSMQFSIGTGSLSTSGSVENILLYVSGGLGGRGRVGFGTKSPKTKFDFKGDGFKVRSKDGKREFQFEEDGRLTAKKFADTTTSESIGSEIQLSYTPGTFDEPSKAQIGETIGTLNWVDESFNEIAAEEDSYLKSGSIAQITSTVRSVNDFGASGDLQLKVNPNPDFPQNELLSFLTIDPVSHGTTVLFPYGITTTTNIMANGNIIGDDSTNITNIATIECDTIKHDSDTDTKITFGTDSITLTAGNKNLITLTESTTNTIALGAAISTPITASSNISASGFISASSFSGDGRGLINVTATATIPAGTISSSVQLPTGIISGSTQIATSISGAFVAPSASFSTRVTINDAKVSYTDAAVTSIINTAGVFSSSAQLPNGIISSSQHVFTSLTASGNISASGNIYMAQTAGGGSENSVVVVESGKLVTDEIDAGVWGNTGAVVTAEGEVIAPLVATIAGLAPNTATTQATQPNITSVGTLTGLTTSGNITASGNISAVGTVVGSNTIKIANTKEFQGASTQTGTDLDATGNWYHSNNEAENAADKYADDSTLEGVIVDGTSVLTPQQVITGGKYIVPTATTCSVWRGAISNKNGNNTAVCLVKATPADNSSTNLVLTVIASASIAGTGNTKMRTFNATLQNTYLDAGDIIVPLVNRYDTSGGSMHFNTTLLFYTEI